MSPSSLPIKEKTSCHARKISLPPTSHPLGGSVEDHLQTLRASSADCGTSSSSSSSLCSELTGIKDLYEQLNGLIQLQLNQQVLSQDIHLPAVESILDGSLTLLDFCGTTLDLVSQMKTSIQSFQSSLRRRSGKDCIDAYMSSRKKFIKMVSKCLITFKNLEKKRPLQNDSSFMSTVNMLREAESITINTMKRLLHFLCGSNPESTHKGLSLFARLKQSRQVSCYQKFYANEVQVIDHELNTLDAKKLSTDVTSVKELLRNLETLEATFTEFEDGLESVSRCLVKTRVSLLNVLTH